MAGSVMGSPQYLSPEQIRGEDLDGRSDVFSLGVVLYEMLSGKRPFDGDTITTLVYQILHKEPPPISELRAVPPRLEELLRRMLAKDRDERLATAGEVARELAAIEAELSDETLSAPAGRRRAMDATRVLPRRTGAGTVPASTPTAPSVPPPPPPPLRRRRRRWRRSCRPPRRGPRRSRSGSPSPRSSCCWPRPSRAAGTCCPGASRRRLSRRLRQTPNPPRRLRSGHPRAHRHGPRGRAVVAGPAAGPAAVLAALGAALHGACPSRPRRRRQQSRPAPAGRPPLTSRPRRRCRRRRRARGRSARPSPRRRAPRGGARASVPAPSASAPQADQTIRTGLQVAFRIAPPGRLRAGRGPGDRHGPGVERRQGSADLHLSGAGLLHGEDQEAGHAGLPDRRRGGRHGRHDAHRRPAPAAGRRRRGQPRTCDRAGARGDRLPRAAGRGRRAGGRPAGGPGAALFGGGFLRAKGEWLELAPGKHRVSSGGARPPPAGHPGRGERDGRQGPREDRRRLGAGRKVDDAVPSAPGSSPRRRAGGAAEPAVPARPAPRWSGSATG